MPEPLTVPPGYAPLINPAGELKYYPEASVKENIDLYGYKIPTEKDIEHATLKKAYGDGFGNELAAAVEGAASGATFGLSRHVENILGITTPEAQAARKEFNPMASGVGEVGGIIGSLAFAPGMALPGLVERGAMKAGAKIVGAGLLEKEGAALIGNRVAQEILGTATQKLAANTVGRALEGMVYGAGMPISESALGDPTITAQKVFGQIGLGGLIGGGVGAATSLLGIGAGRLFRKAELPEAPVTEVKAPHDYTIYQPREKFLSQKVPSSEQRLPSNSIVAQSLPSPGSETNLPSRLTSTLEPGEAAMSIEYMSPSQLNKLPGLTTYGSDLSIHLDYNKIKTLSEANKEPFFAQIQQVTGLVPDVRIKGEESYLGKVDRYIIKQKDPSLIADALAGRVVTDPAETLTALDKIKKSFDVVEAEDYFAKPSDWGYEGINTTVKLPNGQLVELQVHTPESLAAGNAQHKLYEKWRDLDVEMMTPKQIAEKEADRLTSIQIGKDAKAGKYFTAAEEVKPTPEQSKIAQVLKTEDNNVRPKDVQYYQERAAQKIKDPLTGKELNPMEASPRLHPNPQNPQERTLFNEMAASYEDNNQAIKDAGQRARELLTGEVDEAGNILRAAPTIEVPTSDLAGIFEKRIAELEGMKFKGDETLTAIKKLKNKLTQLVDKVDEEGNVIWEAPTELNAAELKAMIHEFDKDLEGVYSRKIGKGMTETERQLVQLRRELSDWLKEDMKAAGFPEYSELMDEMHRRLKVAENWDKYFSANNSYNSRILGALQREVEDVQTTKALTKKGTQSDANWLRAVKDLGDITGKDFRQMYKDRYIWAKFHEAEASYPEKGSAFSQLLKNTFRAIRNPTEIPGKLGEAAMDAPEMLKNLQKRKALEALQGKGAVDSGAVNSILNMIQGGAKSGSKLFDPAGPLGSYMVPAGVKFQQYLDSHDTMESAHSQLEVLTGLEKAQQKADKAIDVAISGIFTGSASPKVDYSGFLGKSSKEAAEDLETISADAARLSNDPNLLVEKLTEGLRGIGDHAPNITTGLNMTAVRAIQFLSQKISTMQPQDQRAPLDEKHVPSKMQLVSLAKTLKYLNSPYEVLKELPSGMVSNEGKEVLVQVYPELYLELKGRVMNGIADQQSRGKAIPTAKRLGLSFFLDQNLDSTLKPQAMQANQAAFMMPMATQNTPKSTGRPDAAGRMMSGTQKIAGRQ